MYSILIHLSLETPLELRDVVNLLGHRASQWRLVGQKLGIPRHVLDTIQSNNAGNPHMSQQCLADVISWHFQQGNILTKKDVACLKIVYTVTTQRKYINCLPL